MPHPAVEVFPCPPGERPAALAILYRDLPDELRPRLVADVLQESARGQVDLSGLRVAWRRGRVVGALLTQGLAGRAAAVWAPEVALTWGRAGVAAALVRSALAELRARGYRIAQALLDESASRHAAADLARGGMPRVTELVYLERPTGPPLEPDPRWPIPGLAWRGYGPSTDTEFREALEATYMGSLDMPELEGARSLDDVLAGHKAGGRFDPDRWRIGRLVGEPETLAVVLLSDLPDRDAWEVAYLGLSPEARGRGLGRAGLDHALELARPVVGRLELAVDVRNLPAYRLYREAGFRPFDRRAVHLATLAP